MHFYYLNRAVLAFWEDAMYGDICIQNAINAIDDILKRKPADGLLWEARKAGMMLKELGA